jgi:uncharacterized protein (DUF1330 family)
MPATALASSVSARRGGRARGERLEPAEVHMAAYFIGEITDVFDPTGFEEYLGLIPATVEHYGGRYLARGGTTELVDGGPPPGRIVIIQFESFERAKAWYDSEEYRYAKSVRRRCTTGRQLFTEGL